MHLPAVNATLNGLAAILLVAGLIAIKRGQREQHARIMRAAFVVSAAFLACYLYYHLAVARGRPTKFNGVGAARVGYFALLISHTVLAVVNLPMVLLTLWFAAWQSSRPALSSWPLCVLVALVICPLLAAVATWLPIDVQWQVRLFGQLVAVAIGVAVALWLTTRIRRRVRVTSWQTHTRLAKWTFPIWLYVSVTGVIVYVVLYHLNPAAPVS